MIVAAFAAGDRVALRPLLADDTYRSFEQAIAAREAAGETQRSEIRAIQQVSIEQAQRSPARSAASRSSSSPTRSPRRSTATASRSHGTDAVTEITDLWTFERDLRSPTRPGA